MIKVSEISKKIENKEILKNISFSLNPGDVLGLVGENGAGKSTLLRIIAGILSQDSGDIAYIHNHQTTHLAKTSIAYVPQEIVLYEDMTVYENLTAFGLGLNDEANVLKNKINMLTEILSIHSYLTDQVSSLSGGLKRRVNIAAGLLGDPCLIIMDEPVVGIDAGKTKDIENMVRHLKQKDCMLIISSHSEDFLANICNKLLVLHQGKIFYFGEFDSKYMDSKGTVYEHYPQNLSPDLN